MFTNIFAYVAAGAMAVSSLSSCTAKDNSAQVIPTASSVTAYAQFTAEYSNRDLDGSYDETTAVKITFSDSGAVCDGDGVSVDGTGVKITKGGVYIISGKAVSGSITIEVPDTEKVQLVLNNADITSSDGAVINEISCDKLFITLVGDNKISDSTNYTFAEGEDEPNGAIFAKHDMTINGEGTLSVNGAYMHGIVSKDDLKITGGTINVTSAEDGIRGRDSVLIKSGAVTIASGGDGIKSNNDKAEDKGRISIDGGVIDITSQTDGIQAESVLQINGGELTVRAGDINAEVKSEGKGNMHMNGGNPPQGGIGGGRGNHGGQPPENGAQPENMPQPPENGMMPNDGEQPPDMKKPPENGDFKQKPQKGDMASDASQKNTNGDDNTAEEKSDSKKAIKSANAIYINSGTLNLSAEDDTVHADCGVTINGGKLLLSSADDAIHADYQTIINGGTIDITKSYEGIEGKSVVINDGNINIIASDDAINAADPSVDDAQPGRGNDEVYIEINGGTINVVSGFDSLDSNGNIFINGGIITLDGPSNGMDCAIDYDGKAYVNGGTLNVSGVSSATFDSTSKQASLAVVFNTRLPANTQVTLCDEKGNQLASISPTQAFGGVLFSSDKIKQGKTYIVKAGDVSVTAEQSSLITAVGQDGSAVIGGGMHGGGMPPQGGRDNGEANGNRPERRPRNDNQNTK